MSEPQTPGHRALVVAKGDSFAIELVGDGIDGTAVTLAIAELSGERELRTWRQAESERGRMVPLLRVIEGDLSVPGQPLATVITGWTTIQATGDGLTITAGLLHDAIVFHTDGSSARISAADALTSDWWGAGSGTSAHWPSGDLQPDDLLAGIVKIHSELTRDGAGAVGDLRREVEELIANAIRRDPAHGEVGARLINLERSLATLIDLARTSTAVRTRLGRSERELSWLWKAGPEGEAEYHAVRDARARNLPRDGMAPRVRSYALAGDQMAAASAALLEEVDASYQLLNGIGSLASARDASGQAQLNRIAGATAILATVLGTVLALYGADLLVPGKDQRPWIVLALLSAVIAALFFGLARAGRDEDDRRWWRFAAIAGAGATLFFGGLAIAQRTPTAHDTELQCQQVAGLLTCVGDQVPTTK